MPRGRPVELSIRVGESLIFPFSGNRCWRTDNAQGQLQKCDCVPGESVGTVVRFAGTDSIVQDATKRS